MIPGIAGLGIIGIRIRVMPQAFYFLLHNVIPGDPEITIKSSKYCKNTKFHKHFYNSGPNFGTGISEYQGNTLFYRHLRNFRCPVGHPTHRNDRETQGFIRI